MTIQLVLSVKDDYFLSIQLLVRKNFLHFITPASISAREVIVDEISVDEMSVDEVS